MHTQLATKRKRRTGKKDKAVQKLTDEQREVMTASVVLLFMFV